MKPQWKTIWVNGEPHRVLTIPELDAYIKQLEEIAHS
jgi:hypothetical protein